MTIRINGTPKTLAQSMNIRELLHELGLVEKPVVVELNRTALFPREYEHHSVKNGDVIEIIEVAAGG